MSNNSNKNIINNKNNISIIGSQNNIQTPAYPYY